MRKAFRAHSVSTSDTSWNIAPGFFHSVPRRSRTQPESSIATARSARARIESPLLQSLEDTRNGIGRACRAIGRFARCPRRSPLRKTANFPVLRDGTMHALGPCEGGRTMGLENLIAYAVVFGVPL